MNRMCTHTRVVALEPARMSHARARARLGPSVFPGPTMLTTRLLGGVAAAAVAVWHARARAREPGLLFIMTAAA